METTRTEKKVVQLHQPCGWCITGLHDMCKPVIEHEGRTYPCGCHLREHRKEA